MKKYLITATVTIVSCTQIPDEPTPPAPPQYEGKVVKMGVDAATIDQAYELIKPTGKGAILFERGKTYSDVLTFKHTIPTLALDAYGEGERPVIKTGGKRFFYKETRTTLDKLTFKNLIIDNEDKPGELFRWLDGGSAEIANVDFLSGGLVVQHFAGDRLKDWTFDNVKVIGAYATGSPDAKIQGLYGQGIDKLTIVNSTFDHNGWNETTPGTANIYNHNIYLDSVTDVLIGGNKIINASSIGIKMRSDVAGGVQNLTIENNYFKNNEILVSVGGNVSGPDRFRNVRILNNVSEDLGKTQPTKRNLAWGYYLEGVNGAVVKDNKFSGVLNTSNKFLIKVDQHSKDVLQDNNTEN